MLMQHKGEECNKVLFPDVHESMLHSDVVPSLLVEQSELLIVLVPTVCANTHFR